MHVFATFTKFNHGVIHSICTIAIHVSRPWTQICPGEIVDTVLPNSSRHDIVPINSAVYAETKTTVHHFLTPPDCSAPRKNNFVFIYGGCALTLKQSMRYMDKILSEALIMLIVASLSESNVMTHRNWTFFFGE